jgi:hypothetical protein
MLKISTTLFTVYAVLIAFMAVPALAQNAPAVGTEASTSTSPSGVERKPDFNKLLADETTKLATEPVAFDPKRSDAIYNKQQTKKGWSTQKKLWVVAGIVGAAALLFVLIKYGKECARSNPVGCTPGVDEFCTCEEYERRIPK